MLSLLLTDSLSHREEKINKAQAAIILRQIANTLDGVDGSYDLKLSLHAHSPSRKETISIMEN